MKFISIDPPREFSVGFGNPPVTMRDCGRVELEPNEQITLTTPLGAEYDIARKSWGFYATPSLNGRLTQFGLHAVLVKNRIGRYFIVLIENGCERLFEEYCAVENLSCVCRLDSTEALRALEERVHAECRFSTI